MSKCVTIPRSLDGRLQVAHRKNLPHVIYCKVWRWPDLASHHELRALQICQFPFSAKQSKDVCINPYHYERVSVDSGMSMLLHQQNNSPLIASHPHTRPGTSAAIASAVQYGNQETSPMNQGGNFNGMVEGFSYQGSVNAASPPAMMNNGNAALSSPFSPSSSSMGIPSPPHNSMPYSPQQQQQQQQSCINSPCGPETPPPAYSPMDEQKYASQLLIPTNDNAMDTSNPFVVSGASSSMMQLAPIQYWCNIAYYELNSRVGEIFHLKSNCTDGYVDGFTNPGFTSPNHTNNRFCLGQLSNVNRNSTIENTRRHIGQGIRLRYNDGKVFVKCLSKHAIFVQSRNCNAIYQNHPTTVCKVPPENELIIFDDSSFASLLTESAKKDYQSVFELSKMCTIRMSFVKGWGADYHRQDVTSTPCWIEIHLLGPLQWLDKVLTQLGSPDNNITSVS